MSEEVNIDPYAAMSRAEWARRMKEKIAALPHDELVAYCMVFAADEMDALFNNQILDEWEKEQANG